MGFLRATGSRLEPRGGGVPRQAGRLALPLVPLLMLGACVGSPGEGPSQFFDNVTGAAMERRGLPPGTDQPFRSLSEVPPRPDRPDDATRGALTRKLEAERAAGATPLTTAGVLPPPPPGASAEVPLAPPRPAALRAAPAVARMAPSPEPARPLPADPGAPPPPPRPLPADPGLPPPPPSIR